jgi:hypothetical protein
MWTAKVEGCIISGADVGTRTRRDQEKDFGVKNGCAQGCSGGYCKTCGSIIPYFRRVIGFPLHDESDAEYDDVKDLEGKSIEERGRLYHGNGEMHRCYACRQACPLLFVRPFCRTE